MITSNAGAEFSTKTTIIVVLRRQPLENAGDLGASLRLPVPPDETRLITQRVYESELLTPTKRSSGSCEKTELCCFNRLKNAPDFGRFRSSNSRL
jgi:hypothetical protein